MQREPRVYLEDILNASTKIEIYTAGMSFKTKFPS